jgi:pimeloyl-ACP methyl ester carboxylesterase
VDSHLGYFSDGSVMKRLHDDVVLPARAAGYRSIWMVGISLGGFASLGYAARHGEHIDGVVALAPYPGTRGLQKEIVDAGGPRAWSRTAADTEADLERAVWRWLADDVPGPRPRPRLYLGLGQDDRFAQGVQLMATTLPAAQTSSVPGGHDWGPWRALWNGWLDRGLLAKPCPASVARSGR